MVTFTKIPYAEAKRRARVQDGIVYAVIVGATLLLAALAFRIIAA